MQIEETKIAGVFLLKPKIFGDSRGYFVETWHKERYKELGINDDFIQDNHSQSIYGTLRGLHFQKKYPQGKLVSVSYGEVLDVALDIRPNSPTFGKWHAEVLSAKNQYQLWIEPGLAHGFVVLSDIAHFHYKCTAYYHPEDEGGILYSDPFLAIDWKVPSPILSDKDKYLPSFKDYFDLK